MTAPALTGTLRLATRGSALARAQTGLASAALTGHLPVSTSLVVLSTGGDRNQSMPVEQMTGQGWFTAEVTRALLDGRADVAVHSAKDLPTEPRAGVVLAALLQRTEAADALVTRDGRGLHALPEAARVGSSSARRRALLRALRPDLTVVPIRGNVDTRLAKLDTGEVDALVVAAAGLLRLGRSERIAETLDPRVFVPAPAQGAIALEAADASPAALAVAGVDDGATRAEVAVERAVLRALGGGCLLPLGAWARHEGSEMVVCAAFEAEGTLRRAEVGGPADQPLELAARVAAGLR